MNSMSNESHESEGESIDAMKHQTSFCAPESIEYENVDVRERSLRRIRQAQRTAAAVVSCRLAHIR